MAKRKSLKSVKKKMANKGAAKAAEKPLTIMVSSTVYGAESDLDSIYGILKGFGYNVVMSKEGNVYVPAGYKPEAACLRAVEDCDLFFGIIFPRYGSGITHKEIRKAIELDKPRWFIAHHYVTFTRKLLEQFMFTKTGKRNKKFEIKPTSVLDSVKVVDMYNDVKTNWTQPFFKTSEVMPFINTQFSDIKLRKEEILKLKSKPKK